MVTMYVVPFLALTVQVDPFSAVIVPITPWPRAALPGAAAEGGAVPVDGVVVVGVALELLDPPEHAATPIATILPILARSRPAMLVIGHSSFDRVQHAEPYRCCAFSVMARLGASNLRTTSELAGR
jgi:hypothetical protein